MLTALFNGYKVNLVETTEDLKEVKTRLNKKIMVGIDTETRGLTYEKGMIVGGCISCGSDYSKENYQGYYLPLRHSVGVNLPEQEVFDFLQELIDDYKTVFFNRNFDVSQLEMEGLHIPFPGNTHDAQIMVHLSQSESLPALKASVKKFLKWDVIEFSENKAKGNDFGTTDPRTSFIYAAGDPLMTVLLARKMWSDYPYIRKIYTLDNKAAEAVRRLSKSELHFDWDIVRREVDKANGRLLEIREQIYAISGMRFNLNSPTEKAEALSRFVTLTQKTRGNKFMMNKEVLQRIDHPLAKLMVQYSTQFKYMNSYVEKMLSYKDKEVCRCAYNSCNVVTGRLSSGGSGTNDYYIPMNAQNFPKEEVVRFIHEDPELGYVINDTEEGSLGKAKAKAGLRDAFIPPNDEYVWMSADYAAEEMRLAANFSNETGFIEPLLQGKDLHTHVAKLMFGFESPEHRTKVKTINFGVLYDMKEHTLSKRIGSSVEEAKALLDKYFKTMRHLADWRKQIVKQGQRTGMVFTYFGRPRLVYQYFNSSNREDRAFGERTCLNHPIQGCIPLDQFVELNGEVAKLRTVLGKKQVLPDGRECVFSHRHNGDCYAALFSGGNFAVCDINHAFVSTRNSEKFYMKLSDFKRNHSVDLSEMRGKTLKISLRQFFTRTSKMSALDLRAVCIKNKSVHSENAIVNAAFWKWALGGACVKMTFQDAAMIRSLGTIYGFNVVYSVKKDGFCCNFRRPSRVRFKDLQFLETVEVGTGTVTSGYHEYPAMGFMNKNTGGDLIRLDLCKLYSILDPTNEDFDKEFADNVQVASSVHDEINYYVKKTYLKKAYDKVKKIMTYHPANFKVPLEVSIGIGRDYGHCLDCDGVTDDNKLIVKL